MTTRCSKTKHRSVALCLVPFVYWAACLIIVAFGIGNEAHFTSSGFQLTRINRLLELSGRPAESSVARATAALLPHAAEPAWVFDAGDDSWLCTVATARWQAAGVTHEAQWVLRYGVDPLWREHFVEAAALNAEAHSATPRMTYRQAIHGDGRVPKEPVDGSYA